MATNINQVRDAATGITTLLIEGEMFLDDAILIERIATDIRSETDDQVTLDLADLDFLDSEAAPVLRGLAHRDGVAIEGIEIFLQSVINNAERHGA